MISIKSKNSLSNSNFKELLETIATIDGVLQYDGSTNIDWKVGQSAVDALKIVLEENQQTLGTAFEFASIVLAKLQNSKAINRLHNASGERFVNERQIAFQFKRTLELFAKKSFNEVIDAEGPDGLSADQMEGVLLPALLYHLLNSEVNYGGQTLIEALLSTGVTSKSLNRIEYDSSCAFDTKAVSVFNKLFTPSLVSKAAEANVTRNGDSYSVEFTPEKLSNLKKELERVNPGIDSSDLAFLLKKVLRTENRLLDQISLGIRLLNETYSDKISKLLPDAGTLNCAHFLRLLQTLLATPITADELEQLINGGLNITSSATKTQLCLEELLWFVTMKKILTTNSANYIWPSTNVNKFIDVLPDILDEAITNNSVEFAERLKRKAIVLTQLLSFMKDLVLFLNNGTAFGSSQNSYNRLTGMLVEGAANEILNLEAGTDYSLEEALGCAFAAAEKESVYNVASSTNDLFRQVIREKVAKIHEAKSISPFTTYSNVEIADFLTLYVDFLTANYKQVVARNLYRTCLMPLLVWSERAKRFYTEDSLAPTDVTLQNAHNLVSKIEAIGLESPFNNVPDLNILFPSFKVSLSEDGELILGDKTEYDITLPVIDSYSLISMENIIDDISKFITFVLGDNAELKKLNQLVIKYLNEFFCVDSELQFPCIGLAVVTDDHNNGTTVSKKLKVLKLLEPQTYKHVEFPVVKTSNSSQDWSLRSVLQDVRPCEVGKGWDLLPQLEKSQTLDINESVTSIDCDGFVLETSDSYDEVINRVVNSSKGRIPYDEHFYAGNGGARIELPNVVKKALIFMQVHKLISFSLQKKEDSFFIKMIKDYNDVLLNKSIQTELQNSFVSYVKRIDGDLPLFARVGFPTFETDEDVLKFTFNIKVPVFINFRETARTILSNDEVKDLITYTHEQLLTKSLLKPIYKNRTLNELGVRKYVTFDSSGYFDETNFKTALMSAVSEPSVITFDSFLGITHRKPYAFNYENFEKEYVDKDTSMCTVGKKVHRMLLPNHMFWYNSGDLVCDPKELEYYLRGYEEVIFKKSELEISRNKAVELLDTFFGHKAISKALNFPNATIIARIRFLIEKEFKKTIGEVVRFWKLKPEHKNTTVADNLIITIHDKKLAEYFNTTFVWAAKLNTPYCSFNESQFMKKTHLNKRKNGKVQNVVRLEFSYDENEIANYRAAAVKVADKLKIQRRVLDVNYELSLQPSSLKLQLSDSKYKIADLVLLKCLAFYSYSLLGYTDLAKLLKEELISAFIILDYFGLYEKYRQISYHGSSGFTMDSIHKLIYETLQGLDPLETVSPNEFKRWISIDESAIGVDLIALLCYKAGCKVELINDRVPSFCNTTQIQLSTPAQKITSFTNKELMVGRLLTWQHFKSYFLTEKSGSDFTEISYVNEVDMGIPVEGGDNIEKDEDQDNEVVERLRNLISSIIVIQDTMLKNKACFTLDSYLTDINNTFEDHLIKPIDEEAFIPGADLKTYIHMGKFIIVENETRYATDSDEVKLDVVKFSDLSSDIQREMNELSGGRIALKDNVMLAKCVPFKDITFREGVVNVQDKLAREDEITLFSVIPASELTPEYKSRLQAQSVELDETEYVSISEEAGEESMDELIHITYKNNEWEVVERKEGVEYMKMDLNQIPNNALLKNSIPSDYKGLIEVDYASYAGFTITEKDGTFFLAHTPDVVPSECHTYEELEDGVRAVINPVTPLHLKGRYKVILIGG